MSKHRIHVEGPIDAGAVVTIRGDQARYLHRVLRLRRDDDVVLFDGSGTEYVATIRSIGKDTVDAETGECVERSVESPLTITLLQGISRGERMDYVVQKATEVGVSTIIPVHTEFSVVKLDERRAEKRVKHWHGVAVSACEQSGRNHIPTIFAPTPLLNVLGEYQANKAAKIILKPGADDSLKSIDAGTTEFIVLIGPEGGFSDKEYENAGAAGFRPLGFGPRILRTETAAVAVLTALQTLFGDLV